MTGVFKSFQPTETTMAWMYDMGEAAEPGPPRGVRHRSGWASTCWGSRRPHKMVQAVDGVSAWIQQGTSAPQALPAAQATQVMQETEFDSVFVDYKSKGLIIDLRGP